MSHHNVRDIRLEIYDVSEKTGFVSESPLEELPEYFESWNRLSKWMSDLVEAKTLRDEVDKMLELDIDRLHGHREWRLAHLQLSIIGAGYVWQNGDGGVPKSVPRCLAVPWYNVSQRLGVQPIISHPGFCLANFKKIDRERPLCLENIKSLYRIPGGEGCDWFIVVTCAIELEFANCLKPILSVLRGVEDNDVNEVIDNLQLMTENIHKLRTILSRMHDKLSSDLFYNVVRPYLAGWGGEGNALPEGLIYEGVENNQPIQVKGGSAAQSTVLQILDVVLGIEHTQDKKDFLDEMRKYILPRHRQLIFDLESLPVNVRSMVSKSLNDELKKEYNTCVKALSDFRSYHLQIVTKYIVMSASRANRNKTYESLATKGTGGTDLIPFLRDLRNDTNDKIFYV